MKIVVQLTKMDFLKFNLHQSLHSPINLVVMAIVFLGFGYSFLAVFKNEHSIAIQILTYIILTILPLVFYLLFLIIIFGINSLSKKNKTHYAETEVTYNTNGIISESKYGKSEFKWNIIQKIRESKNYFMIYVSQNSAIVIPKRIFSSKNDFTEFAKFINSKYVDLSKT